MPIDRRSKKTKALDELKQLSQYAELSDDDKLRKIRELERKLASAKVAGKEAQKKHKQAETDLQLSEDNFERLLATQDDFTVQKLQKRRKRSKGKGQATAIICLNDWHLEENVDPLSINGRNAFNLEIFERRIAQVMDKGLYLLQFARGISDIRDVVVWGGGDLISGYIHEELQENNFLGPAEATVYAQNHLASAIDRLLADADIRSLAFVANYGNHGRSTQKRRISTGWKTSWEWLAYNNVATRYANDNRVRSVIAQGYSTTLDIQGHGVRFHHGDDIRYHGGVGGVCVPLRKKIAAWNQNIQAPALDVLGHFHQYAEDWNYVLCGCLVGFNAYANSIGAAQQPPTQTFIVVDRDYGKVLSMPIFCEAAK